VGELRRILKERLPEHMVPSAFVFLDVLPMTGSGKIDAAALPAPDASRPELDSAYCGPRTPADEALVEIWKSVLLLDRVGVRDNFFELGGHSLLATQVISRAREAFHVDVPLRDLFVNPTIEDLALAIAERQADRFAAGELENLLAEVRAPARKGGPEGR
jgi:acyl carrier protein